jgi:hypothetical protein
MVSHNKRKKMEQTQIGYSKDRIDQLAKPKQSKQGYLTSFGQRQLVWGDKDGMWNITPASLQATAGQRTIQLSKPKKDWKDHTNEVFLYTYSCGRASPLQKLDRRRKLEKGNFIVSKRLDKLSEPKHKPGSKGKLWTYSCGRESPIWNIKKNVTDRPSTSDKRLALPKLPHKKFAPNRELRQDGRLSESFMNKLKAKASDNICGVRLESLAECKTSKEKDAKWSNKKYIDFGRPEQAIRPVLKETMSYQATEIIEKLAVPNVNRFKDYVPDRFHWPVSRAALQHKINEQTEKLAEPVQRPSMEHTQYDMNCFFVKSAALKAKCSNRLAELATPIHR